MTFPENAATQDDLNAIRKIRAAQDSDVSNPSAAAAAYSKDPQGAILCCKLCGFPLSTLGHQCPATATPANPPRSLCNCQNCQTDNCQAGVELAAAREEIGLLISTLDNRNKTIEYMQDRLASAVELPPEPPCVHYMPERFSLNDIIALLKYGNTLRSAFTSQIRAITAEIAALKHDIARYIQVCADQATELVIVREELAQERKDNGQFGMGG